MSEYGQHETIRYTADVVALHTGEDGQLRVLLIQRRWDPYAGRWALPGGHVDRGETARQAGARELAEETGVVVVADDLVEIGVFDAPGRDPRGRYVSVAFAVVLDRPAQPSAGDDAAQAEWKPAALTADELAFDHHAILTAVAGTSSAVANLAPPGEGYCVNATTQAALDRHDRCRCWPWRRWSITFRAVRWLHAARLVPPYVIRGGGPDHTGCLLFIRDRSLPWIDQLPPNGTTAD